MADKDLSEIPANKIKEINKAMKKGANDASINWSNALALVDWAFLQCGVHLPAPDMEKAWEQYEEAIAYGVEALADARGINSNWRTSYDLVDEGSLASYRVAVVKGEELLEVFSVKGFSMQEAITAAKKIIRENNEEVQIIRQDDESAFGSLHYHNVDIKTEISIVRI